KRFISYYKPHIRMFTLDMVASLLVSVIGMCYPILTRKVFNDFVPNANITMILIFGGVLLVLYFIRMLLRYFVQYYGHVIGVKMQAQMRSDMFKHLEELPYSYYDEHETGKIMSRMTNDLQNVSELAHHGPENLFICGFMVIGSFVYLCTINWLLSLIIFACVPILVAISLIMRKRMREAFTETRKNVAIINSSLESSISGIRVTKAFTNNEKEIEKFEIGNDQYVKSRSKAYKAMGAFSSSTNFIMDLFYLVCVVAGGIIAITTDTFLTADYLAFVVSISLFISPLTTLINFVEQYQDGTTGFKRFLEIMDEKPEKENPNAIEDVSLQGNIEFKNVYFSYETKANILNDISFKINKGETIALVGESGGGKTTICHLIPNFYKVTSGEILIDGININDLSFKALRRAIGIVQQDVFLFNGTIKENILYGKLDASFEEVVLASKRANIYDYIMTLPDGFDTEIGERGVKLSGGQKQRLSIARVFLKNPPILILDEATSALDNTTEIMIQDALNELAKGRTTIVVAHRLSTIKNANRIFVVNAGVIVEEGSHEELLSLNGIYARLYNLQFRNDLLS
ncbi:MAG: ABC transporter ATP-binding protein, partial [Bacillales bacterium]|nr:ABC transporter ATP-binding protein [Bacillales bacterium]